MDTSSSTSDAQDVNQQPAFDAQWEDEDAARLHPVHLPIVRVPRAWERKPLSPRNRLHIRVAKVWKRATSTTRTTGYARLGADVPGTQKRSSGGTELKAVKKLCLDSEFGMGARVAQWETRDSPERKIVTRSLISDNGLVALDEHEADEQGDVGTTLELEDATIEILDEDGTVLETDANLEDIEQDKDWEVIEEPDDAARDLNSVKTDDQGDATEVDDAPQPRVVDRINNNADHATAEVASLEGQDQESSASAAAADEADPIHSLHLPDGFATPIKPRRLGQRASEAATTSRRRTLPVKFAPAYLLIHGSENNVGADTHEDVRAVVNAQVSQLTDAEIENTEEMEFAEEEWKNAEAGIDATFDAASDTNSPIAEAYDMDDRDQPMKQESAATHKPSARIASSPVATIEGPHPRLPLRRSPRRKSTSPLKLALPVSSTAASHLIAFTPLKRSSRHPPSNLRAGLHPCPTVTDPASALQDADPGVNDLTIPHANLAQHAPSEPPEQLGRSPQKPTKPRVSDDTALIQAFLSRAAESKHSRGISTSTRESMTNRRDSDQVRQALASPGEMVRPDVLMDLDPNSPSPRKAPAYLGFDHALRDKKTESIDGDAKSEQVDDQIEDTQVLPKTRRSGRGRNQAQVLTSAVYSEPAKIKFKGQANNVDVKRSEAQELAVVTRNNTRKNKGGAVLPKHRLPKLAASENGPVDVETNVEDGGAAVEFKEGYAAEISDDASHKWQQRSVKWAETLATFNEGPDLSQLSDDSQLEERLPRERSGKAALDEAADTNGDAPVSQTLRSSVPPPAADTPSKPKLRRLRPSRTTSSATNGPAKPPLEPTESVPPVIYGSDDVISSSQTAMLAASSDKTKPARPIAKTKKSRIATPAKGLTNASLLPADVGAQSQAEQVSSKRRLVSKLPAPPLGLSLVPSTAMVAAATAGKENSLASPPKKMRGTAVAALPTAKTAGLKLDLRKVTLQQLGSEAEMVPGLASPAKRAGRRANLFATAGRGAESESERGKDEVPGLNSPAKKRTRKVIG